MSQPLPATNSQLQWLLINFILKPEEGQAVAFLASTEAATALPSFNCSA